MAHSQSSKMFRGSESSIRTLLVNLRVGSFLHLMSPQLPLDGATLVGEAVTCQEALSLCSRMQPDVILLDLRDPSANCDGTTLLTIHERYPQLQLVAVSSLPVQSDLKKLHDAGVIHVLAETDTTRKLAGVLSTLFLKSPPSPTDEAKSPSLKAYPRRDLTIREQQALGWALTGRSNQEIAKRLDVNTLTARFHIQNALGKLRAVPVYAQTEELQDSEPPAPSVRERAGPISANDREQVADTSWIPL